MAQEQNSHGPQKAWRLNIMASTTSLKWAYISGEVYERVAMISVSWGTALHRNQVRKSKFMESLLSLKSCSVKTLIANLLHIYV